MMTQVYVCLQSHMPVQVCLSVLRNENIKNKTNHGFRRGRQTDRPMAPPHMHILSQTCKHQTKIKQRYKTINNSQTYSHKLSGCKRTQTVIICLFCVLVLFQDNMTKLINTIFYSCSQYNMSTFHIFVMTKRCVGLVILHINNYTKISVQHNIMLYQWQIR